MSINGWKQQTDLLADCFQEALEAYPGVIEAVASANLPAELEVECHALLVATATIWEHWRALGAKIKAETAPTTIQ